MIFVNSMSDLFHEEIPNDYIAQIFDVMAACPQHTFQVLTKRPERMRDKILVHWGGWEPPPNIWWGTSIENRRYVSRADVLRDTPAAVRFISAEPLLGPLVASLRSAAWPCMWWEHGKMVATEEEDYGLNLDGIHWLIVGGESGPHHRPIDPQWVRDLRDACADLTWDGENYSEDAGGRLLDRVPHTAFFFKQWGGRTPKANGRVLDGRTWNEMPGGNHGG